MSETGFIKSLRKDKGYGFLIDSETGQDVFFHCKNAKDFEVLEVGAMVSYVARVTRKGMAAFNVRVTKKSGDLNK